MPRSGRGVFSLSHSSQGRCHIAAEGHRNKENNVLFSAVLNIFLSDSLRLKDFLSFVLMNHSEFIEMFPIVDEEGNTIGEAPRTVCHDGKSMLLHPVVHLHLFNTKGELFLQKRAMTKDIQPGKWDTSVGGHISPGETVEEALFREAGEELALNVFEPQFKGKYIWKSSRERELVNSFTTISDQVPVINIDEIEEGRYWSPEEIYQALGKDIFTPNFEYEFGKLF
jgi:isopentenyldiphosphate isomerase